MSISTRLRWVHDYGIVASPMLLLEAAKKIDQLQDALKQIEDESLGLLPDRFSLANRIGKIARAALEAKP